MLSNSHLALSIASESSAFRDSTVQHRSTNEDEDESNETSNAISVVSRSPHSELRISIPYAPSIAVADADSVDDGPPMVPRTALTQSEFPAYPPASSSGSGPFTRALNDPNVNLAVRQFNTHKSAVALLHTDVGGKRLRDLSRRSPSRVYLPPLAPSAPDTDAALTGAEAFPARASASPHPPSAWAAPRAPGKNSSKHSAREVEMPLVSSKSLPTLLPVDGAHTRAAHGPSPSSAALSSGQRRASGDAGGAPHAESDEDVVGTPSMGKDCVSHNGFSGKEGERSYGPEESSGSSDVDMERVLSEFSKARGVRLSWLMYFMIGIVILLFVLVFLVISISSNATVTKSGAHMLQILSVSMTNNAELLRYDLLELFLLLGASVSFANGALFNVSSDLFCSRIYSAPIAIVHYNASGAMLYELVCEPKNLAGANVPETLPSESVIPSPLYPRMIGHSDLAWAAYYSSETSPGAYGTTVVFLHKSTVGRFLYSNYLASYSTATLQSAFVGVLVPSWDSFTPSVSLSTLSNDSPTYTAPQPTEMGAHLQKTFDTICEGGQSKYTWNFVFRESRLLQDTDADEDEEEQLDPSKNSTSYVFPKPYEEHKGSWGVTSRMLLCSALCTDLDARQCDQTNPTAMWFIAETTLDELRQEKSLNAVGAISIVSVVLFLLILILAYVGISVPIHFLRFQLLRTVGSKTEGSKRERWIFRVSRRFWIGDLMSLVRAIHVLSICFRLNKKYVPEHVLRNHARQLYASRGRLNMLEKQIDHDADDNSASDEDNDGSRSAENVLDNLSEFVATTVLPRESSTRLMVASASVNATPMTLMPVDPLEPAALSSMSLRMDASGRVSEQRSLSFGASGRSATASPPPTRTVHTMVHPPSASARDGMPEEQISFSLHPPSTREGLPTDVSIDIGDPAAFGSASYAAPAMQLRRNDDATMMCISIGDVENAYLLNYSLAMRQHRRLMRFLLARIRQHKGSIFYRSGECLAAVWNAFSSCYNHAECAALCAQDIAYAFAPYRREGLQVGIVLHQGTFVYGTVEGAKEAFATAFGEGPRQLFRLADLATVQPSFSIIITEPVKQALSSRYECMIVDVIDFSECTNSLILFELGAPRTAGGKGSGSSEPYLFPTSSDLLVLYATAFSHFRNHEFKAAIDGIHTIRQTCACTMRVERLLHRLEALSAYYREHDADLPIPYARLFPSWDNFELVAELAHFGAADSPSTDSTPLPAETAKDGDGCESATASSPAATRAPAVADRCAGSHDEGMVADASDTVRGDGSLVCSPSPPPAQFALPNVLYSKAPGVFADEISFKRELHDNVKRYGSPGQYSPVSRPTTSPTVPGSANSGLLILRDSGTADADAACSRKAVGALPPLITSVPATSSEVEQPEIASSPSTARGAAGTAAPGPLDASTLGAETGPFSTSEEQTAPRGRARTVTGPGQTETDAPTTGEGAQTVISAADSSASPHGSPSTTGPQLSLEADVTSVASPLTPETLHTSKQRFAAAHDEPANIQAMTPSPDSPEVVVRAGSFMSLPSDCLAADGNTASVIQSIGVTLADGPDGQLHAPTFSASDLTKKIVGKNGTTYMRSGRLLGRGSFGQVFLGMDIHSGKLVAIKFLPLPNDESELGGIEAEVIIMQRVKDSHVVEFITYAFENSSIVLVMECMMAGSLQNMISAFCAIPSSTARVFLRDVLRGLNKLHSMGVIHRDVKPQNVLLTLAGNCKISDFGASAWLHELARKEMQGQVHGTPVYLAPEAARGKPVEASDIWSCGIMFIQLVTGHLPYAEDKLSLPAPLLVYQIGCGDASPVIPETLDELDTAFVRCCLQTKPAERKTARQLLQMPLFTV